MAMMSVIAVDGPAGAGKSTVCRRLAERMGYAYLDTGAMYRAIAWALLQEGTALDDEGAVTERLPRLPLEFALVDGYTVVRYAARELDPELRGPEVTGAASRVAQCKAVREFLVEWQRKLGRQGGLVAEGRDMGTVVFPDAALKVFLTADVGVRAQRRLEEYRERGVVVDAAELEAAIRARDAADSERAVSPLRQAEDAHRVDTSKMDIEEVVSALVDLAGKHTQC